MDDCVLGEKDCSLALLGDEEREEAFMERMLNNSRRDFGPNNVAVPNRLFFYMNMINKSRKGKFFKVYIERTLYRKKAFGIQV